MNNVLDFVKIMRNPMGFFNALSQSEQAMKNPMLQNAVQMVQNQDGKGLEKLARNMCKNAGVDADELYNQTKQRFGIK